LSFAGGVEVEAKTDVTAWKCQGQGIHFDIPIGKMLGHQWLSRWLKLQS